MRVLPAWRACARARPWPCAARRASRTRGSSQTPAMRSRASTLSEGVATRGPRAPQCTQTQRLEREPRRRSRGRKKTESEAARHARSS
eukprot:6185195-Pleurochrysis_carterae.AAC.1